MLVSGALLRFGKGKGKGWGDKRERKGERRCCEGVERCLAKGRLTTGEYWKYVLEWCGVCRRLC